MFGTNPIRPPIHDAGEQLLVQEIFPTLQGEGPFAGWPAVFVRLGGCNLACSFCDTEFESFTPIALHDVVATIRTQAMNDEGARVRQLVVITGGEPLRQNIVPLCETLLAAGFRVQIETNGTLWRPLPDAVDVVCSPKASAQGYGRVRPDVLARASALKFIIQADATHYHSVPEVGQADFPALPIYVQPMDEQDAEKNARNTESALALCHQHGYRLSLQTHKMLNIP